MSVSKRQNLTKKTNFWNYEMISFDIRVCWASFHCTVFFFSFIDNSGIYFPLLSLWFLSAMFSNFMHCMYRKKSGEEEMNSFVHVSTTCSGHLAPKCYFTFTIQLCILAPCSLWRPLAFTSQIIEDHFCETPAFYAHSAIT